MVRNALLVTNRILLRIFLISAGHNVPANREGWMCACQSTSSAIQLPMPGKPSCINSTALMGALEWRARNFPMSFRVNSGERSSTGRLLHQEGAFFP